MQPFQNLSVLYCTQKSYSVLCTRLHILLLSMLFALQPAADSEELPLGFKVHNPVHFAWVCMFRHRFISILNSLHAMAALKSSVKASRPRSPS